MTERDCPPHHWLIEPPEGEKSKGRCKRCGEDGEFRNSYPNPEFYKALPHIRAERTKSPQELSELKAIKTILGSELSPDSPSDPSIGNDQK